MESINKTSPRYARVKVQVNFLDELPKGVYMDIVNEATGKQGRNGSRFVMTTFLSIVTNVGYKVIMRMKAEDCILN